MKEYKWSWVRTLFAWEPRPVPEMSFCPTWGWSQWWWKKQQSNKYNNVENSYCKLLKDQKLFEVWSLFLHERHNQTDNIRRECANVAWVRLLPLSSPPPPPTATRGITTAATPIPTWERNRPFYNDHPTSHLAAIMHATCLRGTFVWCALICILGLQVLTSNPRRPSFCDLVRVSKTMMTGTPVCFTLLFPLKSINDNE